MIMMVYCKKLLYRSVMDEIKRCGWVTSDPLYIRYHDTEWGVPVHDDRKFFEFLILEGAQAGLSWLTILKRRQGYCNAFCEFDPEQVARFSEADIQKRLQDPGIIRNKLKVRSAVTNAQAFLKIQEAFGTFDAYAWQFVDGAPIINHYTSQEQVPATSSQSNAFSKNLCKRGFKFTGSTIIYAYMQATGMVNDHLVSCFRYKKVMA